MHDYYYSRYVASRLEELRAEAGRERLARQAGRHRRRLWPAAVAGVIDRWLRPRRDAVTCCA